MMRWPGAVSLRERGVQGCGQWHGAARQRFLGSMRLGSACSRAPHLSGRRRVSCSGRSGPASGWRRYAHEASPCLWTPLHRSCFFTGSSCPGLLATFFDVLFCALILLHALWEQMSQLPLDGGRTHGGVLLCRGLVVQFLPAFRADGLSVLACLHGWGTGHQG